MNWQFLFFGPDLPKKGFFGLKQKKWTPHIFYIIVHIQFSLVRNFTSDNFDFWTKFAQKGISSRKQKKWASPWNSAYWNKSRYKISTETDNFEVLDQMYPKKGISSRKQNKQSKDYKRLHLKLMMVMIKSFDKYHHFFNLLILVTIFFFMIEIQAYWILYNNTLT